MFVFGIVMDIGFDMLMFGFKSMLKKINIFFILVMKYMLFSMIWCVIVCMLGEIYKVVLVYLFNVIVIKMLIVIVKVLI